MHSDISRGETPRISKPRNSETNSKNAFGTADPLARVFTISLRTSEKLTMVSIDLMRFGDHRPLGRLNVAFRHVEQSFERSEELRAEFVVVAVGVFVN